MSSSGVTLCIVMNNDGFLYLRVSSYSPENLTNVLLQEYAVVGSIYCLSCRYSMLHYYPINVTCHSERHFHSTLCRVWYTLFGLGEPGCFHSFDWHFKFGSYEQAKVLYIVTIHPRKSAPSLWYQSKKACA